MERGTLVHVLAAWRMAELPVHAYFPMGRATRLAARSFVDFIADEIKARSFDFVHEKA